MRKKEKEKGGHAPVEISAAGTGRGFHVPDAVSSLPPAPTLSPTLSPTPPSSPTKGGINGRRNGKRGTVNGSVTSVNGGATRKDSASKLALHVPLPAKGRALRGITLIPGGLRGADVAPAWIPGIAIAGIVLACLMIGVPFFVLESTITAERTTVETLEARHGDAMRRAAIAEKDLESYRRTMARAGALRELLDQHQSWAPFFQLLESQTLPSVQYESVTADVSGSVMLPVMAPSVRAAAEQAAAWQRAAGVSGAEISGIASTTDALGVIRGTRFDLRFRINPEIFTAAPVVNGTPKSAAGESPSARGN